MAKSALQEEISKRHPFECPEEEAALNLLRTVDHLGQEFTRLFHEYGISGPQYNVLRILRGVGGEGLPCVDIAGRMITRMPDITRLVDRLEAAGLVARRRTEEDRRVVLVTITAAGLELLARLDRPVLDLHRRQLGHLTRAELAELNRLLVKARRPG
jgi:DNA-binding MarR family transcriptional regulator